MNIRIIISINYSPSSFSYPSDGSPEEIPGALISENEKEKSMMLIYRITGSNINKKRQEGKVIFNDAHN